MLKLDINRPDGQSGMRSLVENTYDRIAGNDDYQRNERSLGLIQICVITVSACATGFVNAFAHKERLGLVGAGILALLLTGFVEKFYFALRHGLTTIYKARKQRLAATLCYRAIQITMILNAAILCAWVVGAELPEPLRLFNRWSIAIHFGLALVGVSAVRDADAVVEHRIRKLKAEAIQEDIATIRRAAINDNPLVIAAAKVRGILDGITLAIQLIRDKSVFPANDVKQIHDPSPRLYLPGGGERNVTDISGKSRRRWNEAPELGTPLQSQASSPVQDKSEGSEQVRYDRDEDTTRVSVIGEQSIGVSSDTGEQTVDEQAKESKDSKTVSKAHSITAHSGERIGEQSPENGESHDKQQLADEPVNESEDEYIRGELCAPEGEQRAGLKNGANDDGSVQSAYNVVGKSEQKGEQPAQVILLSTAHRNGPSTSDEQTPDEQSAQWLKSLLPEASNGNGWWEVRTKPKGFVLMFRWRDPDLQVLTLQSVTRDQIEQFKQIDSEDDAKGRIREQIVLSLRKLSFDPAKRDKAWIAAEKLGIDLLVHTVSASIGSEI